MKIRFVLFSFFLLPFFSFASTKGKTSFFYGDLFFPLYGTKCDLSFLFSDSSEKENSSLSFSGGFLGANPSLDEFSSDFYSGFGKINLSSSKLSFSEGVFVSSFPGKTMIQTGKPKFILEDGDFLGTFASISYRFSENTNVSVSGFAESGGFDSGDLYYFFGHPDSLLICGGNFFASLPFKINLSLFLGSVEFKIRADNTENKTNLGNASGNVFGFYAEKGFSSRNKRHFFDAKLFFSYADFFGRAKATSETQDYVFFPYEKILGRSDGFFSLCGLGFSYEYSRHFFSFGFDSFYAFCLKSVINFDYNYTYKKNLLFDGSSESDSGKIDEITNCGVFLGRMFFSLDLKNLFRLKNASPVFVLERFFTLPLITEDAKEKFGLSKISSGSVSSINIDAEEMLKTIFLRGLVLSLKIGF